MDQKEIAEVLKMVQKKETAAINGKSVLESVMKIITSLTLGGVLWLLSSMIEIREKMIAFEINMENVQNFASKPRFTREDHLMEIQPIIQDINTHKEALVERKIWMKEQEKQRIEMQLELQELGNQLKEIKDKMSLK